MAEKSLAADLLADFDDSDDEDLDLENGTPDFSSNGLLNDQPNNGVKPRSSSRSEDPNGMDIDGDSDEDMDEDEERAFALRADASEVATGELSVDDDEETRKGKVEKMKLGDVEDVRSVAKLMKVLEPVLENIEFFKNQPPSNSRGAAEDDPEYMLLVESNAHAVSIDNEIILVHKFIRDHYNARFPELENLVTNPLDYAKCVSIIGNNLDIKSLEASNGHQLQQILDGPTLMVVTVEATTSAGRELSEKELATCMRGADMVQSLDAAKRTITSYVESRMSIFAPNTSAIVGSQTAAQLINFAGGLRGLAATPSCNIAALGSKRQTKTVGLATNIGIRQQGYLYHSPIIRNIPTDYKKQAMRIVSGKLVLASRIDFSHSSPDGSKGEELKEQVLEKLEKLTIPPPNIGHRALPAPDDKPSKKRGGRRARKAKEATAMTELRKAQNRMAFGKQEEEVGYGAGDATKGLGMIGQAQSGRVRALKVDQRTQAKLSKSNKGWAGIATPAGGAQSLFRGTGSSAGPGLAALGGRSVVPGSAGGMSGTASSINFTPFQGLELIDPKVAEAKKRKDREEEDKYFSGGTFTQVGGGNMGPPSKKQDTGAKGLMLPPKLPRKT